LSKSIEQSLQTLIEDVLESNQTVQSGSKDNQVFSGIQLYVNAPNSDLTWGGAAGFPDRRGNEVITAQHPVRLASNTKTFVAAAILRLWEQQQLELDAAISQYISEQHNQLLINHGYEPANISLRHLLTHTSGLFDYADCSEFENAVGDDPQHRWTRTEQLQLAMDYGQPYGEPGEVYRYSDTGYILLGEIVERVYGQSLGLALRQLLDYQGLGLTSTWLEVDEPAPAGLLPRVHQYVAEEDSYDFHGSFDAFGGGGLISTVGDMARFMRALFRGNVYSEPNTLKEMLTTVAAKRGGPIAYGSLPQIPGTYRLGIDAGETGTVYSHSGFLGTYAAYVPSHDLSFSLSINQHFIKAQKQKLIAAIFDLFDIAQ